jgi:hypothetical protein
VIVGSAGFRPNREYEALSRRAKRYLRWLPGARAKAKRRFWKQVRQEAKRALRRSAPPR